MPYVYVDELSDEMVEAEVVEQADYDALRESMEEVETQRDDAITRIETLERDLRDSRNKFADAFLSSPERAKKANEEDVKKERKIQTFDELFDGRNGYNAN